MPVINEFRYSTYFITLFLKKCPALFCPILYDNVVLCPMLYHIERHHLKKILTHIHNMIQLKACFLLLFNYLIFLYYE